MVKKPFKGNYLQLEDARISYDLKTDTVNLTSKDPAIPKGQGFKISMNKGRDAEYILREILENAQLIPKDRYKSITRYTSYRNAISHDRWDVFPLGVHANNEEAVWSVTDAAHALVIGRSGSGKTNLVRNVMYHCLQNPNKWEIFAIDLKGDENQPFVAKNSQIIHLTQSPVEALEYIQKVHSEMHRRYQEISEVNVRSYKELHSRPHAVMLIIDGLDVIHYPGRDIFSPNPTEREEILKEEYLRQEIRGRLTEISRLGRSAGIHLMLLTQSIMDGEINHELRSNLSMRIATSRLSPKQSHTLLYDESASQFNEAINGRGYIKNIQSESDRGADFQAYSFPHDSFTKE